MSARDDNAFGSADRPPTREPRHRRCGGARLAGHRRCARERVRGMSESPVATRESVGEGVAGSGVRVSQNCRIDHKATNCVCERIGWRGLTTWRPEVVRSCSSPNSHSDRTESAGEGVAGSGVRVPQSCRVDHKAELKRRPSVSESCSLRLLQHLLDVLEARKWVGADLNCRPPPCQGGVITGLDYQPAGAH